jgi:hypothetical protein
MQALNEKTDPQLNWKKLSAFEDKMAIYTGQAQLLRD